MDAPDVIAKKIRSAVTDSEQGITLSDHRPGLKNILTLLSLTSNKPLEATAESFRDSGMKDLKDATAEALVEYLTPLQKRVNELLKDRDELLKTIELGSQSAREAAQKKLVDVREKIGVSL